jgi:alpha-methylacyl-CoA racemase
MLARHKSSVPVDLKSPGGISLVKELAKHSDVIIDPFRPGVLEKLGLGPDILCGLNPRLIYGRISGFRRDGKYSNMAGHDINYLAVSGVLSLLGRSDEKPYAPYNIVADFAGGGAVLFQGILLALMARQANGQGQVVEANMVDGSSYLASFPRFALHTPLGNLPRGQNILDGGCPWYDTYETRDGKFMAVGAIEPQFFAQLVYLLGLKELGWDQSRYDRDTWPAMRRAFEAVFKEKTRQEWEEVFDGTDACCTPVLNYPELERDAKREGDQRPAVNLRNTPCLAVTEGPTSLFQGQGTGVLGSGYHGRPLRPGEGGEHALREWMGWKLGREIEIQHGGLVLKGASKL